MIFVASAFLYAFFGLDYQHDHSRGGTRLLAHPQEWGDWRAGREAGTIGHLLDAFLGIAEATHGIGEVFGHRRHLRDRGIGSGIVASEEGLVCPSQNQPTCGSARVEMFAGHLITEAIRQFFASGGGDLAWLCWCFGLHVFHRFGSKMWIEPESSTDSKDDSALLKRLRNLHFLLTMA